MADRITLTGLRCRARHGVLDSERRRGQRFEIDITCWLEDAGAGDDLARTVNYAELAETARAIMEDGPARNLIETVAAEIAETAMRRHPILHAVEVTVHKPDAPIPLDFADVSVTARRSRKTMAGRG